MIKKLSRRPPRGSRLARHLQLEFLEPRQLLTAAATITEFMTKNGGFLRDGHGNSPDWIEIHNAGDEAVDLAGYHLTDSQMSPKRWPFPSVQLEAGGYLIVFASGNLEPDPQGHLHTNFALGTRGEYVALTDPDGQVLSEYGAHGTDFPPQRLNVSYGIAQSQPSDVQATTGYMLTPTPGAENVDNSQILQGLVQDTMFSVDRGFYEQPIAVEIRSATDGATIRYTTDGSVPSREHGETYVGPLAISRTTMLRAMAYKDGLVPTNTDTQTYVFLADILTQSGEGLPETWGTFPFGSTEARQGDPVPANYAMDPEVVNDPRYRDTMADDLKSLPIISVVMDPDDLWGADDGIYSHTVEEGPEWERAASIELFHPDGTTEFQIDAGVRIHGGFGRRPSATAKHSLRLFFKSEYGASKLEYPWFGEDQVDRFDTLVLRANYNYSWMRGNRGGTQTGKDYAVVTDRWAAVTQNEMGGLAPNGVFVHLYLNGLYWGIYNPTERPDASFQAEHRGGTKEEYDVMNHEGIVDGDRNAWNEMQTIVRGRDMEAIERVLDLDNYIDYMILNQFGGNEDWPQNNWYASRRRADGERWQFHSWDAEFFFIDPLDNRVSSIPNEGPGIIYTRLRSDVDFRMRYADRIYKWFYNDGALTPAANIARLEQLASIVDRAVVGESARWGDAWMDQVSPPRTRDDDWVPRIEQLKNEYFPQRHDTILAQFRAARLLPNVAAPVLSQHGGEVRHDFQLTLQHEAADAVVYYTLDGSDPRLPGGAVSPSAIPDDGSPISTPPGSQFKSRAILGDDWSPLVDVFFTASGDVTDDGTVDANDLDATCAAIRSGQNDIQFDLDRNGIVDHADHQYLVETILKTTAGDANLDGIFNSSDFVVVFLAGQYEDSIPDNSGWATGDWNCDGEFSSQDIVTAFLAGGYSSQLQPITATAGEITTAVRNEIVAATQADRIFAASVNGREALARWPSGSHDRDAPSDRTRLPKRFDTGRYARQNSTDGEMRRDCERPESTLDEQAIDGAWLDQSTPQFSIAQDSLRGALNAVVQPQWRKKGSDRG